MAGSKFTEFTLLGDKTLIAKMKALDRQIGRRVMFRAVGEGARVIMRRAKLLAMPGAVLSEQATGDMSKAIRVRVRKNRFDEVYGKVYVSRKHAGKDGSKPGNVAHLVEYGHGGPHPAEKHPFMRPAIDSQRRTALAAVADKAWAEIKKLAGGL